MNLMRVSPLGAIGLVISLTCLIVWWKFDSDVAQAKSRAQQDGLILQTRCGSIEYQEIGTGVPLLMVHGSGGGHDQGIAFAGALAQQGIRVIPSTVANSVAPLSPWVETLILQLIGSDFVFWTALHVARDQVIKYVLATPPEQVATASPQERDRVNRVLENILPVSARALGLRSDSVLGRGIARYALESIRAPTLVISARDDGFGTYASAEYTASQVAGAQFIGFDHGGHLWVGHDDEVQAAIVKFVNPPSRP
jgi:pimeloyl-ACP methyl ester carboxylesterase